MIFSKYKLNFQGLLDRMEKHHAGKVPSFDEVTEQIKADYQVSVSFRSMFIAICLGEVNEDLEKVMKKVERDTPIIRNLFDSMMIACEQPETAAFQLKNIMFQLEIEKSDLLFLASDEFITITERIDSAQKSPSIN